MVNLTIILKWDDFSSVTPSALDALMSCRRRVLIRTTTPIMGRVAKIVVYVPIIRVVLPVQREIRLIGSGRSWFRVLQCLTAAVPVSGERIR